MAVTNRRLGHTYYLLERANVRLESKISKTIFFKLTFSGSRGAYSEPVTSG